MVSSEAQATYAQPAGPHGDSQGHGQGNDVDPIPQSDWMLADDTVTHTGGNWAAAAWRGSTATPGQVLP